MGLGGKTSLSRSAAEHFPIEFRRCRGWLLYRQIPTAYAVGYRTSARFGVCRKIHLCGSLCDLRASVVNVFISNFTTETRRSTEFAQRNAFSDRLLRGLAESTV